MNNPTDLRARAASAAPATVTILVVDDDSAVRSIASLFLEREGFRVLQAGSGAEALAIRSSQPVDVLLTDVQMPGMDGIELARQFKTIQSQSPIVLMSGFVGEAAVAESGLPLVPKPFTPESLAGAIRSALPNRAAKVRPERQVA